MLTQSSGSVDFSVQAKSITWCPGNVLRYDADLDEYSSDISGSRMRGGPKHGRESVFDWNARYAKLDGYHNEVVVSPD